MLSHYHLEFEFPQLCLFLFQLLGPTSLRLAGRTGGRAPEISLEKVSTLTLFDNSSFDHMAICYTMFDRNRPLALMVTKCAPVKSRVLCCGLEFVTSMCL